MTALQDERRCVLRALIPSVDPVLSLQVVYGLPGYAHVEGDHAGIVVVPAESALEHRALGLVQRIFQAFGQIIRQSRWLEGLGETTTAPTFSTLP